MIRTPHKFYPLVVFCERSHPSGNTSRWIERSMAFDHRHDPFKLHILFARQVGKLMLRKGKPLMEMPYTLSMNCWGLGGYSLCGDRATHECLAELEYLCYSTEYDQRKKPARKAEVSAEAIVENELFGDETT